MSLGVCMYNAILRRIAVKVRTSNIHTVTSSLSIVTTVYCLYWRYVLHSTALYMQFIFPDRPCTARFTLGVNIYRN